MSHPPALLERTSSVPRRSSLVRPTLPSLASWTTPSSFTPTKLPALHPPTSAGSTSSLEADEAVTPADGSSFPPPPSHLKMPSPNPSHEGDFSPAVTVKAPLAEFRVQDIPPFRGGGGDGGGSSANLRRRPSTAGAPPPSLAASAGASIPPSALPTSLAAAHPEGGYRRASVASVFSLPRPNPPSASSSASISAAAAAVRQPSQPAPVTMGLGIAGVGVGQSGQREALVIERLGEPNSHGRRGSLKRVLVSEDDDEQDLLRASLGSRESDRSRMDGSDSSIPLPLQQPSVLAHAHSSRREGSPLNPSSAAARRAGSSSPPQPGSIARNYSTAAATGRDSPTASKRARTALSPLESLAATATNLLTAPSVSSSSSTNSLSGAPPRPSSSSSSVSNVLSSFMLGQPSAPPSNREQAEAYEATQRLREQYERRKELQPPAPGSLGAALGKLRATAEAEGMGGFSSSEVRGGGGNSRSKSAIPAASGEGGLGKRRGHRPPAVNTASSSNAGPSSSSARSHHPYPPPASSIRAEDTLAPLRSATGLEIPSVLVGSPVDPSFAARAARELAPMRTAQTGPTRRTSRSGASSSLGAGAEREERRERERERDERPYPSVVQVQQQQSSSNNQPPLVSSSTYYIRPNQPLGPGVPFPSTSTPSTSSNSNNKALPPPPPSAGPRLPSFASTARASPPQPAFHPLHQQRPTSSGGGGPGVPLSPLAPIRNAPPPPPHSSAPLASPAQYASAAPPFHHPHPPPQSAPVGPSSTSSGGVALPSSSAPASASKTAFLSLFSTFYDSLSDSRILSSTLETQISRASQLLHTLQHAETVLETMVDERVGKVERGWEERLRGVEGRLGALEAQRRQPEEGLPLSSTTLSAVAAEETQRARTPLDERRGSGESAETAITSASGVEERLDRIEKQLAEAAAAGGSREREALGEGEAGKDGEAEGRKAVEGTEEEMPAQAQRLSG